MTISDEPKIVKITWMDAVSIDATPALVEMENMETLHPVISYIVGYLIQDNEDCYVLSKEFWPEPMKIKYLHVIPKGAVVKIEELFTKKEAGTKILHQEGNWSEITYYLSPTFVMFRDRLEKDSVKRMGMGKGRKSTVWKLGEEKPIKEEPQETVTEVTPEEKELPKKLPKELPKKAGRPTVMTQEFKNKIIEVLKKKNNINCISIAREIFGPETKPNCKDGVSVKKICKELADDGIITQEKIGIGIINTLIDSKISDSEIKKDLPKPTGETFMDRDEMADKIMDSLLDTAYKSKRELNSIVLGTTNPNSKEGAKVKRAIDTLQKFKIIEMDGSGDAPTWFLTDEGEEIAKNKRAKKEANNDTKN